MIFPIDFTFVKHCIPFCQLRTPSPHVSQQTRSKSSPESLFVLPLLTFLPAHWPCLPSSGCPPCMDSPGSLFQVPPSVLIFPRHLLLRSIVYNHRYTPMSEHFPVFPLFDDYRLQNQEEKGKEAHWLLLLPIFQYLAVPYGAWLALQRFVFRTIYLK